MVAADAFTIEPNSLWISKHVVGNAILGRKPLQVVQISDLHLQHIGRHEEKVAEAVHHLKPDLLVFGGDMIDRSDRLPVLRSFLTILPRGGTSCAVLGNWEHWARVDLEQLRTIYEDHQVHLLINATVNLEHHGIRVLVTGMDDATGGNPDLHRALDGVEPSVNHLLLAHSPVYRDQLGSESAAGDLVVFSPQFMLSGHTHGGQITLFGWAPFRPPGSGRYLRGWYRDGAPHLYVSQGVGTSVLPARFGAAPEIASFTWYLRTNDGPKGTGPRAQF